MKKIISLLLVLGTFTSTAWADIYSCRSPSNGYVFQSLSLILKNTAPLQVTADVTFSHTRVNAYSDGEAFTTTKFKGQFDGRIHRLHNGVTIIALSGITTSDDDGTERWSSFTMSETTLKNGIIERKLEEKRISGGKRPVEQNISWICTLAQKKNCDYGKCRDREID